jgi:hypothetical protein
MRYSHVPVGGTGLDQYLQALAPTRANGGTVVCRLKATGMAEPSRWFSTATFADEHEAFRGLLTSDAAGSAMPDVVVGEVFPPGQPPVFHQVTSGALLLEGELAGMLSRGGAYVPYAGTDAEAKQLAAAAARDLLQDRYEDFRVFFSDVPWTSWFFDIAWDVTWLLVDDANHEVTIIVSTDTD